MKQNQFHAIFPLCVCMLSLFSRAQLFELLLTVAHQTPLSLGFSRQEFWSGLPFPSLRIFPIQGSNPGLLHALEGVFFTTSTTSTQRIAKEPELAQVTRRMIYAGPSKFGVCLQQYTHRSALSFQWSCYISQPTGACLFVCVCVHF